MPDCRSSGHQKYSSWITLIKDDVGRMFHVSVLRLWNCSPLKSEIGKTWVTFKAHCKGDRYLMRFLERAEGKLTTLKWGERVQMSS